MAPNESNDCVREKQWQKITLVYSAPVYVTLDTDTSEVTEVHVDDESSTLQRTEQGSRRPTTSAMTSRKSLLPLGSRATRYGPHGSSDSDF
jgi:hypothetical protein